MDLGVRVQGSVPGHENGAPTQSELGSGFAKQDRSGFDGEDYWRSSKLGRTEDFSGCKTLSFHQGIPLLRSTSLVSSDPRRQEHMLSFSSSDKSEALDFSKDDGLDNKSCLSPYLQQFASSYSRNAGFDSGGMMNTSMHGNVTGVRGPFTLTQWAELEQQALIYKYITANVPIPSSLLLSLKKSFYPYAHGSLPPNSFGWGSFHLGFSGGNMDPEPGRCRRTDGKKWRCSRDAVPDQKYCERHINRGRHRSRKPVEGHSGHNAASKAAIPSPLKASAASNPSTDSLANRVQNSRGASVFPSTVSSQHKESPVAHQKQENPFEFGLSSSASLMNMSQKSSYMNSAKGFGSYLDFSGQEKHSSNPNIVSWPEELKSDWTQLSMSIPMASSEFSASPASPAQEKLALSPLRLSREFDPTIQMGLGVNAEILEPVKKVNNWIPISWGSSLGGPLGEVLNSTTNSPKLGSSPTGVLQKSSFCSLSNSSSGSSPVGENKKGGDGAGLCEDLLGQTLLSSSSAPSM
ncbi:PREDICTED: growth-regulating factor 1-like [Tarenaya hassleriana]|uniref:growth-regulating factor 1-like n=1 Tax=Tarenaya hassleriana TaxID=28532 RepID=UPI00053C4A07|nr:PREDICTED: growth-regulating factor 1-like [Tarenaya hassleriana]